MQKITESKKRIYIMQNTMVRGGGWIAGGRKKWTLKIKGEKIKKGEGKREKISLKHGLKGPKIAYFLVIKSKNFAPADNATLYVGEKTNLKDSKAQVHAPAKKEKVLL